MTIETHTRDVIGSDALNYLDCSNLRVAIPNCADPDSIDGASL